MDACATQVPLFSSAAVPSVVRSVQDSEFRVSRNRTCHSLRSLRFTKSGEQEQENDRALLPSVPGSVLAGGFHPQLPRPHRPASGPNPGPATGLAHNPGLRLLRSNPDYGSYADSALRRATDHEHPHRHRRTQPP